jgi:hypothetical protein
LFDTTSLRRLAEIKDAFLYLESFFGLVARAIHRLLYFSGNP